MVKLDVLVLGAGTAGTYAATTAKQHTESVGIIEQGRSGGDCIFHACIPTKAMVHAARTYKKIKRADFFGLEPVATAPDYGKVKAFKDRLVAEISEGHDEGLTKKGIRLFKGGARFTSPHEVVVSGEVISADKIIIATGAPPAVPPIPGLTEAGYLTNVEALQIEKVPERLAIIGGGPVGAEFAQIFSAFGSRVRIYEALDRVLAGEDEEVSEAAAGLFNKQGISVMTSAKVKGVERSASGKVLKVEGPGGQELREEYDEVLVATGRKPGIEGLDIEAAGITSNRKGVLVDASLRTNVPHIYAAGDVTGTALFTLIAWEQGEVAGWNVTKAEQKMLSYDILPHVVFCDPEVAGVGLTEARAREKGFKVKTGKFELANLTRTMVSDETDGFVKIIAEEGSGRILGAYIIGIEASTLVHEIAVAMSRELTVTDIGNTFHAYPTFSEGIRYACQAMA